MGAILDGTPFPTEDVNVFNERARWPKLQIGP